MNTIEYQLVKESKLNGSTSYWVKSKMNGVPNGCKHFYTEEDARKYYKIVIESAFIPGEEILESETIEIKE